MFIIHFPSFDMTNTLKLCKGIQRPEKLPGYGCVVAQVRLPSLRRHNHERDTDRVMRIRFRVAVLNRLAGKSALVCSGDVEHACLKATRTKAPPMCLSQAQDKGVFDGTLRLKSFSKAAEDLLVFLS